MKKIIAKPGIKTSTKRKGVRVILHLSFVNFLHFRATNFVGCDTFVYINP